MPEPDDARLSAEQIERLASIAAETDRVFWSAYLQTDLHDCWPHMDGVRKDWFRAIVSAVASALTADLHARTTALRQAREALRSYGSHLLSCEARPKQEELWTRPERCSCGLAAALATIEAALEGFHE